MGIDGKYGSITTERGNIGPDEPVFLFRSKDRLLPLVLDYYANLCAGAGSPDAHVALVKGAKFRVEEWQKQEENFTQIPTSQWFTEKL